jgi:hypothetical protein
MKASNQFILRKIAQEQLLIPVGEAAIEVRGLIALSESGGLLFEKLQNGCTREDLIRTLTEEYEVTEAVAAEDTDAFLDQMRQLKILEE